MTKNFTRQGCLSWGVMTLESMTTTLRGRLALAVQVGCLSSEAYKGASIGTS